VLDGLVERYRAQGRELRACEPGDLIEWAGDIRRFRGKPLALSPEVLDLAWAGYFGTGPPLTSGRVGIEAAGITGEAVADERPHGRPH